MAVPQAGQCEPISGSDLVVCVTPEAQNRLRPSEIWYHFGGWYDEGDTYDTQLEQFEEELDRFWANLVGPDEHVRTQILLSLRAIRRPWRSVTAVRDGTVTIHHQDGSVKTLQPPVSRHPTA